MRRRISVPCIAGALLLIGAAAQTVPSPMLGMWGWEAVSCARPGDDGRLSVKARSLEFYASLFELQTIVLQPDGSVRADATYREEGEEKSSRAEIRLKIISPGNLMVQTGLTLSSIRDQKQDHDRGANR